MANDECSWGTSARKPAPSASTTGTARLRTVFELVGRQRAESSQVGRGRVLRQILLSYVSDSKDKWRMHL